MASENDIVKRFNDFAGLDLRSGDLRREQEYSPSLWNVDIVKTTDRNLEKRIGGKIVGAKTSAPYLGIFNHQYVDTNGEIQEQIIGIDEYLRKRTTSTFTVDYTGAASSATFSFYCDPDTLTFVCAIDVAGTVTEFDVGTGLEAAPVTMADLRTSIQTLASFTVTISGTTTEPAALLPLTVEQDVATVAYAFPYYEWSAINHTWGATPPFDVYESKKFEDFFENANLVNYQQCAVIATGYEYLHKYDGQTVYRFGMPEPSTAATLALVGAGAITDTNLEYFYRYVQKDNRGITNFGMRSEFSARLSPVAQNINVTIQNLLAGTGFNTNSASVNGAQVGVTVITVTAGHTLKVGDTAYFYDGAGAAFVERLITAIAATTVTVAGAVVNVTNGLAISNNLRIQLWRNTAGGLEFYKVIEFANNSLSATTVYLDSMTTATLLTKEKWAEPIHIPDVLASKPKYLAVHEAGVLCAAGDPAFHDIIYFTDPAYPEAFPAASHNFFIKSRIAGPVSGIHAVPGGLAVFKQRAVYIDTSDLPRLLFNPPRKEHEGQIGAVSHASILDVGDDVWFLSFEGPRRLRGGLFLDRDEDGAVVTSNVDPLFRNKEMSDTHHLQLKRSVGFVDVRNDKAIWYVPTETFATPARYPNDNSLVILWDYSQKAWLAWRNKTFACGMVDYEDGIWWMHKDYDSVGGNFYSHLWRQHDTRTDYDYQDHHEVIDWLFASQWEPGVSVDVLMLINYLTVYSQTSQPWAFGLDYRTERNFLADVADSKGMMSFGDASSSGYGIGGWGTSIYGSPSVGKITRKLNTDDCCKVMRFVFSNSEPNQNVVLSGYSYPISYPYGIRIKGG